MVNNKSLPSIAYIVVTYGNEDCIVQLLGAVNKEKNNNDQIIIIDNHPNYGCAEIAEKLGFVDVVVRSENIGFSGGCNLGAKKAETDLLFFINPDAIPQKGAITNLRQVNLNEYDAFMPLLIMKENRVNSAGNVVHISGLSWCGGYGESATLFTKNTEIDYISGACLVVKKQVYIELGGMYEGYFMYYEDTDFSIRLKKAGYRLGLIPNAKILHDYDYAKSSLKWYLIERNRHIFILRNWPFSIVFLLLPVLLIAEIGLLIVAVLDGRIYSKLKADLKAIMMMPETLKSRKNIKNIISINEFIKLLSPKINTDQLPKIMKSKLINAPFVIYYRVVRIFI